MVKPGGTLIEGKGNGNVLGNVEGNGGICPFGGVSLAVGRAELLALVDVRGGGDGRTAGVVVPTSGVRGATGSFVGAVGVGAVGVAVAGVICVAVGRVGVGLSFMLLTTRATTTPTPKRSGSAINIHMDDRFFRFGLRASGSL